jgi:putative PIN family toxin of toxin-antitoxin system
VNSPLRVVLDTNVVLSALVFGGGQAAHLRRAWQAGAFVPLVSAATVQELLRVLAYPKFALARADQDELLADFLPYAQTVRMPQPLPPVPECRDPLDVPFLQLAVTGQAQRLVSGDKDLLAVAQAFHQASGCRVTTLSALLSEIAAGEVAPGG